MKSSGRASQSSDSEAQLTGRQGIVNAMTVDVEDYFQVSAFEEQITRNQWSNYPPRVEDNTLRLLDLFDRFDVKATFFVLGWVAERFPRLIRQISKQGHEVGSHGPMHERVSSLSPTDFRRGVVQTRSLLEDITGASVIGYRAPSFSIGPDQTWAWEILAESGHRYSSSIYPGQLDHYGFSGAPRRAFWVEDADILEIPVSTLDVAGKRMPVGGGGYFRLYPYWVFSAGIHWLNARERLPAMFYLHPWEIDPAQPRVSGLSRKTRFRHYLNLHKTEGRLNRLLHDFQWGPMMDVFDVTNYPPSSNQDCTELERRFG
jgi:polysaccharide deacetylase family protein (PEP-CTERM system associated)